MKDDSGNMSIDFLVGCTIFILSFIWVATMIPGMMIDLQSSSVDFDAVAYRTGVILIEDPGWPVSPPWETSLGDRKDNVTRFGLALTKERPNIISDAKLSRFTCSTEINPLIGFEYPEEYHDRVIFGDYPYHFNISIRDIPRNELRTIGEIRPEGYGYIRRLAKIKTTSNATINHLVVSNFSYMDPEPNNMVTLHTFSVLINNTYLKDTIKDPAFQIDPSQDELMINLTELRSTMNAPDPDLIDIELKNISIYTLEGGKMNYKRTFAEPIVDDVYYYDTSSNYATIPAVQNSLCLRIRPDTVSEILKGANYPIYVNMTFNLTRESSFLNNSATRPFDYNYHPKNVTQPQLRDAIIEVAVW